MKAKPAMLECGRCGKIFIGWETDDRPKRGPTCLRCQAREAWSVLATTIAPKKRGAAGGRARVRKPAGRSAARGKARKPSGASTKRRRERDR